VKNIRLMGLEKFESNDFIELKFVQSDFIPIHLDRSIFVCHEELSPRI
jgi:hypothetical protein